MIGPTPLAFTIHQMKNVIPAVGATIALSVKRCRLEDGTRLVCRELLKVKGSTCILWIGNQIAGSEINQKRKKHIKSRVVVPEDAGRWFTAKGHSVIES